MPHNRNCTIHKQRTFTRMITCQLGWEWLLFLTFYTYNKNDMNQPSSDQLRCDRYTVRSHGKAVHDHAWSGIRTKSILLVWSDRQRYCNCIGFWGGLPFTAVSVREKGQFRPHGVGDVPKCCGIRLVHAAVGAPVGSAVVRVAKSSKSPHDDTATAVFTILRDSAFCFKFRAVFSPLLIAL